jgi:ubiquitin carboxyl-terminal hydrolase 36/42
MPFLSNLSSPLPGGDIHLRDMNFDTSSEASFPMTDSYNLDTDPFPVGRSTMNKLNHSLHTSENGAIGIPFGNNNHNADEETRSSEILSGNKVVFGKLLQFTSYSAPYMFVLNNSISTLWLQVSSSEAKSGNCDATYPVKSTSQQSSITSPETRKRPKSSITVYKPDMGVYLTSDMISSCEGPYASGTVPLQRSLSSGKAIGKGNTVHNGPPYSSGRVAASQKSQEVFTSHQTDDHEKNTCNNSDQS